MLKDTNITKLFVNENANIEQLLTVLSKQVNSNFGSGFAIILDDDGNMAGIVEDSDLRKFLYKNSFRNPTIKEVMQTNFISVSNNLSEIEIINEIIVQLDSRGWQTNLPVKIIPILDDRKPIGLIDAAEMNSVIQQHKNNYVVIGLGYIGLTLALSLASRGRNVYGFDTDSKRIELLRQHKSYILEPGIDSLLQKHLSSNFHVSSSLYLVNEKPGNQNIYFICVGTPLDSDMNPDLGPVWSVVKDLVRIIKNGDVIVMRSTIPIGFGNEIVSFIESKLSWSVGINFHYVAAPERTIEGNALKEIIDLPQIISGATASCQLMGLNIFRGLANSVTPINKIEGAELIKIIGNAYRDYIFGFSNYLIEICRKYELDINQIIESSNRGYPRSNIPSPSPGVGGPCLSKDTYFLPRSNNQNRISPLIVVRNVNERVPEESVEFIARIIPNLNQFKCVGIGIAFKGIPETNDFRNSPSIYFLNSLKAIIKSIKVWDSAISNTDSYIPYPIDNEFDIYSFYAILNNNPKNIEFFTRKVVGSNTEEIIVFDPWRLINPNQVTYSNKVKLVHYISLSHYEKFSVLK
jgi:nucleotide sugar dehydrogenase